MEYYVYTYFYEDGTAYYVGKGKRYRFYERHDVPIPEHKFIQRFHFTTEIEAWDTEIQLIAFYGRIQDGGTLMNRTLGGPGARGCVWTEEQRKRQSIAASKWQRERGAATKGRCGPQSPSSKSYKVITPSGDVITIKGMRQFCRQNNLSFGCMSAVARGERSHHKGFKCSSI